MSEATDRAQVRNCYCRLWDTAPSVLEDQGVPAGYCGMCVDCGAPGHLRHGPGAMPATLSWCDRCYGKVTIAAYTRELSIWLAIGAAAWGAWIVAAAAGLVWAAVTCWMVWPNRRKAPA